MAAPAERVKQAAHIKTIIERGASWTLEETKLLLKLWGQDQVSRKDTAHKRTKEVYEKIASQFNEHGYERTPDQVRTRVFNMIAEYRRILKDPNPEKMKKCIFFDAMHKIYAAQHWSEVRPLLCEYDINGRPYSPFSGEKLAMDETFNSDNDTFDGQDHDNSSTEANTNNNNNNMDTSESKQNQTTHTSATSDNNTDSSINEKSTTEKNPGINDEQPNSHKRICLITNVNSANSAPVAGTSQGESASDAKHDTSSTTSNNVGGVPSSATNAQSASTSPPSTAATQSTASGKLQSILAPVASGSSTQASPMATSTTSTMSSATSSALPNPIIKLATSGNNSASYINFNPTKLPIVRSQIVGHSNGNDSANTNGTQASGTRLPTTAAITSHQLYQAPVNTFDVTSSALLIDRMFSHLSRESENMREWIALEKDRIALEKARRAQDIERESRRERVLIDTLMKFQEQWLNYLSRTNPSLLNGPIPELNIPPRESE